MAEDKALDKGFKQRKEFADQEQFIDQLYKLYRRRQKKAVVDEAPIAKADECPEGLDAGVWKRFVELRDQKLALEGSIRSKGNELAEATSYLQRRAAEEDYYITKIDSATRTQRALQDERNRKIIDLDIVVELRQGQVELQHTDDFDPLFNDAVYINSRVIEELNTQTKKLGSAKVAHLQEKMERMRSVRYIEWEYKRLEMYGCVYMYVKCVFYSTQGS